MTIENLDDFTEPPFQIRPKRLAETIMFNSYADLAKWAENESVFWGELRGKTGKSSNWGEAVANHIHGHYSTLHTWAQTAHTNKSDLNARNGIVSKFEETNEGIWPVSDEPAGRMVEKFINHDPDRAVAHAAIASKSPFNIPNPAGPIVSALFRACLDNAVDQDGVEAREESLQRMRSTWDGRFRTNEKHQQSLFAQGEDALKTGTRLARKAVRQAVRRMRDHDKRMLEIEEAYKTKIAVQAADTYWGQRAKTHNLQAMGARKLLIIFGIIGLIITILLIWVSSFTVLEGHDFKAVNAMQMIVFGLPAVMYIWIMRIIVGRWRRHNTLREDAEHRLSMLSTFLALNAEGIASDEERIMMLGALFRSSGEEQEDETMPMIMDAILKKIPTK